MKVVMIILTKCDCLAYYNMYLMIFFQCLYHKVHRIQNTEKKSNYNFGYTYTGLR